MSQLASVHIYGLEKASAYPVGGMIAITVSSPDATISNPGADFTVYLSADTAGRLRESIEKACASHHAFHQDRNEEGSPQRTVEQNPSTKVAAKS